MRLKVDISQEQYDALKRFAEQHNVTVSDILSNYVADLTCINSNGSDERDMASSYFQRTHLSWMYKEEVASKDGSQIWLVKNVMK